MTEYEVIDAACRGEDKLLARNRKDLVGDHCLYVTKLSFASL